MAWYWIEPVDTLDSMISKKTNYVLAGGIIVMAVIITFILYMWQESINKAEQHLHKVEELRQAGAHIDTMRQIALARTSLLYNMRTTNDPFELDELQQEFSFKAGEFISVRNKLLALNLSEQVRAIWHKAAPGMNTTGSAQNQAAALFIANKKQEADAILLNEAIPAQYEGQKNLSQMLKLQQAEGKVALNEAHENKKTITYSIFIIGTIALFLTFGIMIFIVHLTSQIHKNILHADEAKLASKMKSDFLARMSHEIRTPLGAILGYAESLTDAQQTVEERTQGTQRIIYNANHLLELINEILDLSKVESGKLELEKLPISPIDLAGDVVNITRIKADEKHLVCNVNYILPLPRQIVGDPTRLKQALVNLLSNAIKFTEFGHIYLNVSYSAQDDRICFEVEDTGIGFTDEQKAKIFNAFTQADTSTSRKYGGTGLGLNLCKNLVEQMGGEISVKSKPGVGSRFMITLERGRPEDMGLVYELDNRLPAPKTPNRPKQYTRLQGKVLLVEDNKDNQYIISSLIKKAGAEVVIAENGAKALEKINTINEFDLILMDMQMPVMDGPTTTRVLREQGCELPIVALTANAYKSDHERCICAGCNEFMTKPVSQDKLYKKLRQYLTEADEAPENEDYLIKQTEFSDDPKFTEIMNRYIKNLDKVNDELKQAASNTDWSEMRRLLHDVVGSAGAIGLEQLGDLSAEMENRLRNQDYNNVLDMLIKFETLAKRIVRANLNEGSAEIYPIRNNTL